LEKWSYYLSFTSFILGALLKRHDGVLFGLCGIRWESFEKIY